MNANVTVSLPDELILKAEAWAKQSGRELSEFLAETIEASLVPFLANPESINDWSDADVLSVLEGQLPQTDDDRLSELLKQQNDNQLSILELAELRARMTNYQERLLMKSAALREAVKRGLRQPPKT